MNKNKIKKIIKNLLQYHLNGEGGSGWDTLKDYYKEELNDGKDFKPDKTNKAKA